MPKIVDHEERRRQLGGAIWRVILRDGPHAATVRAVAREAGLSSGALRHYFASQRELRAFHLLLLRERIQARIDVEQPEADLPIPELVARIAEQLIPLDDERRAECDVWLAMSEWARDDPALETTWSEAWTEQRSLWRQLVAALHGLDPPPTGRKHPDPLVERGAAYLHVVVDGLALQTRYAPAEMPPDRVRAVLRSFLDDLVATRATATP